VSLLGADDLAFRLGALGGEQFVVAVVCADDVKQVGEAIVVIVAYVRAEQGLRDRAGWVDGVRNLDEAAEDAFGFFRLRRVVDLIPNTVQDDAGVVAIAHDGVVLIQQGPFVEEEMIVVSVFADGPAIEHLVHDEESHAVAEV